VKLLAVDKISKSFRGLRAVSQASFEIPEGSINALIGPNGAGKTTLFNVIAGVFPPDSGAVLFEGKPIHGLRPHQVCAAGIGRTFQIVKPFGGLTVLENVMVGAFLREPSARGARAAAMTILERLQLADRRDALAASLTLPDRKRLEVARALATRPKLLLLDEAMAGLRPTECDQMVEAFRGLNREGLTILLIEHVMRAVMALARHVGVLHHGEVIARGTPQEIVRNRAVLESYLGEDTEL
jgi:branched-chain amino acid transport system ATP-binding protein